jgi:hypothetical protein
MKTRRVLSIEDNIYKYIFHSDLFNTNKTQNNELVNVPIRTKSTIVSASFSVKSQ